MNILDKIDKYLIKDGKVNEADTKTLNIFISGDDDDVKIKKLKAMEYTDGEIKKMFRNYNRVWKNLGPNQDLYRELKMYL